MQTFFYFIRKVTIPPVFAAAFLVTLYCTDAAYLGNLYQLICGVIFLGILPALGYPLQKYIPPFNEKGREGQRILVMIFSMIGYLLGTLVSFLGQSSQELHITYLLYLSCGIIMFLFNKGLHLKASGHACGITAPILLFLQFQMFLPAMIGLLLAVPVMTASVKTKRHTPLQLIGGCLIAIVCMIVIRFLYI